MEIYFTSIIILIIEIFFIVYFIIHSKKNSTIVSRETALWFLPVFLFNVALYFIAYRYNGEKIQIFDIFNAIALGLRTFTFQIEVPLIQNAFKENIFFMLAFSVAYVLSVFTTVGTAVGLTKNYFLNAIKVRRTLSKSCDIVIGFNKTSLEYYRNNPAGTLLWLNNADDYTNIQFLYEQKIPFIKGDIALKTFKSKNFRKAIKYNFVAFDYEEKNYQKLISEFIKISQQKDIIIFLFLEVKYEEAEVVREEYLKYQQDLKAKELKYHLFIRTFSRYELTTRKFVEEVTLPSLLPDDFFNANKTVKEEKEINVFFFGFGKVNASLFSVFCQNNQLVKQVGSSLQSKLVNYYVIDKDYDATNDKRIEYIVNNSNKFVTNLPQPEKLCNFTKINKDINSYETIERVTEIANKKNTFNFIVVSYGSDFENIETAMWLYNQFDEKNTTIACRVKQSRVQNDKIIFFGEEAEIVNREYIVEEKLQQIARDIDAEYTALYDEESVKKDPLAKYKHWDEMGQIELYSNYYSALNLRFKLNLMGFDLTTDPAVQGVSREDFMRVYNKDQTQENDYFGTSIRNVLAYSEKLRWNAFYIFNGYKPMPKNKLTIIEKKNTKKKAFEVYRKDPIKKTHACLTSHAGLTDLQNYIQTKLIKDNEEYQKINNDYYSYDYMVLDNEYSNIMKSLFGGQYKVVPLNKKNREN